MKLGTMENAVTKIKKKKEKEVCVVNYPLINY